MMHNSKKQADKSVLCFCNTHRTWGGGEKWHLEAALAYVKRGYNVLALAEPDGRLYAQLRRHAMHVANDTEAVGSLTVLPLRIGRLSFLNPLTLLHVVRLLRHYAVRTLIMGLPSELKSVGLAARMAGVPCILYRRGSALPVRNSASNRFLYEHVLSALIVNSQQTRDLVLINNSHLLPHSRIHLLPNGLDAPSFDASIAAASPVFRESSSQIVIGNAGRLNRQKGQHHLLSMLKVLRDNGVDARLVIAGDGELRPQLEELALCLGITKHVCFAGFQDDLGDFWKSIDIFVLSSHWEGFGYVLAESMLARVPVVAFGISNIPELINDGEQGVLVPFVSSQETTVEECLTVCSQGAMHEASAADMALAEAVARLAKDSALRERMGSAGRKRALSRYAHDASMDELERIISIYHL